MPINHYENDLSLLVEIVKNLEPLDNLRVVKSDDKIAVLRFNHERKVIETWVFNNEAS